MKRGEITTQQIVILVIFAVCVLVGIFFLLRLDLGGESDSQICRDSVVLRAGGSVLAETVPLNCKKQYLCLTEDGECENVDNVLVEKVSTKNEIYYILAEKMSDCWWMFGEGEINYLAEDYTVKSYCSICYQIEFAESLGNIFPDNELNQKEFMEFLEREKYSEDKTYLNYLYGLNDLEILDLEFNNLDLGKDYFILMGISNDVSAMKWAITGGVLIGALLATPVTGGASLLSVVGILQVIGGATIGAGVSAGVGFLVEGISGNWYLSPMLIEANEEIFDSLNCSEVVTI